MNIAEVVPSLAENRGGPSRSVWELSGALAEDPRDQVTLLTSEGHQQSRERPGLQLQVVTPSWPQMLGASRMLRQKLAGAPWHVIHHHGLWLRSLHYARSVARVQGIPLVISPRGMASPWAWHHHRWRKKLAESFIHPGAITGASGWHATSGNEADELRERGFTQPICVSPNGVTINSTEELRRAREQWHARFPMLGQNRVALFYSRFHSKKRVMELLQVWGEIAPRGWILLMAGIPEEYSVPALQEKIPGSVRESVVVASGEGHLAPYPVASLFLLPTHHENFGMVVAEALAAAVPVLVTDTTPWDEINKNSAGWCVAWNAFAPTLRRALREDDGTLAARGKIGQAWVTSAFSWEKSARELRAFYSQLSGNA